jgi:DNA-binding NtrC family response regulator
MASQLQVLILEDLESDAELMVHELKQAGFLTDWKRVDTEDQYLAALESDPDLIMADYSLPQLDALRALLLMQERTLDIPFIVVSGAIAKDLAAEFMKQGASDYLIKDRLARLGQAAVTALEQRELRKNRRVAEDAVQEAKLAAEYGKAQYEQFVSMISDPQLRIKWGLATI